MAALQKQRALALGYDEEEAEAIGIAQATKYAIYKNLALYGRKEGEKSGAAGGRAVPLDKERYQVFELFAREGRPFVGGRTYTAEDYRRSLRLRWGEEVADKLEHWAREIIATTPREVLENERRFFREVWVPHRDDPI